jgi:hypothetical protein
MVFWQFWWLQVFFALSALIVIVNVLTECLTVHTSSTKTSIQMHIDGLIFVIQCSVLTSWNPQQTFMIVIIVFPSHSASHAVRMSYSPRLKRRAPNRNSIFWSHLNEILNKHSSRNCNFPFSSFSIFSCDLWCRLPVAYVQVSVLEIASFARDIWIRLATIRRSLFLPFHQWGHFGR